MRYGRPFLREQLKKLITTSLAKLVIFPLFPQYASATTGSALAAFFAEFGKLPNTPPMEIVPPFFGNEEFLEAFAGRGRACLAKEKPDHVLFSFHGLPEKHIRKAERIKRFCLKKDDACCAQMGKVNLYCYRAQCFETARRIAEKLQLKPETYTICFQSRMGPVAWIKPYTDKTILRLAKEGVKNILVFCPAFVADCLETLEEIAIRGKVAFLQAGGERLTLVPSLNATDRWVDAVVSLVKTAPHPSPNYVAHPSNPQAQG